MKNALVAFAAAVAGLALAAPAAAATFTNSAPIAINDNGPATPYPSEITVTGFAPTQVVTKVTLTISGFSHTYPSDADMLLVGPSGARMVVLSDVGDGTDVDNLTITLDDAAAAPLPIGHPSQLRSGTFRPTDGNDYPADAFPAPAPAFTAGVDEAAPAGTATFANRFNGTSPNGTWSLYVVDDTDGDVGSISGGWTLDITAASPTTAGQIVISELRLRGPNGPSDEFVELYNTLDTPIIAQAADASAGLALAASDRVPRCTIPNGTVLPAHGHYLCANAGGYSLGGYPAGNGTTALADATYTTNIPDNAGIALFNTAAGAASFTLANRLDAAGSTAEADGTYREGAGYPGLIASQTESSFYRDLRPAGVPKDTGSNASDFLFVSTSGTDVGAGRRLGAPGPENLLAPVSTGGLAIDVSDPLKADTDAPNRIYDPAPDPANNSTFGTESLRRRITNNTGAPITRLRFRIVDLTTYPPLAGASDLRARTSSAVVVSLTGGGTVTAEGTTLEQPPSQPGGGGFNSSLGAATVTTTSPLADGASMYVNFVLGVQQRGSETFAVCAEALPSGGGCFTYTASGAPPTAVADASAAAVRTSRGVSVRWRTRNEIDLLGFRVYRLGGTKRTLLTHGVLFAQSRFEGSSYTYLDRRAPRQGDVPYLIEALHLDGTHTWFGPVVAREAR
jgi:subtilisin-like proprotein convertase family protein